MHKGTQQLASLVIIQAGFSLCPPDNPINGRALSLGRRLSLFSEVGYYQYFSFVGRDPFNQNFRKFRSKTQWIGSVQPEKFRKNGSTF